MKYDFKSGLFFSLILMLLSVTAYCDYGGGSGTALDPWRIYDADDLAAISANSTHWDDHFIITSTEIDLSGMSYNPIGSNDIRFQGTFDGNNCTIRNLDLDRSDNFLGLFNYIGENGQVKNLTVVATLSSTKAAIGMIAANNFGKIINCHSQGTITSTSRVGGIAAYNYPNAIITNSSSSCNVTTSSNSAGGIVGSNTGEVTACSTTGNITAGTNHAGGIVGYNGLTGSVENCFADTYNSATTSNAGGIAGYCVSGGVIQYCISVGSSYSDPSVSLSLIGGVVGDNLSSNVQYNIWNETTSGLTVAFGRTTVTGLENKGGTINQLKTAESSTFYQGLSWSFSDLWSFASGIYPYLNLVADTTIDYSESFSFANNLDIIIPVEVSNISYYSGGEYIDLAVFIGQSPEEIEYLSSPTFIIYDLLTIPEAQGSKEYNINISNTPYYSFDAGTYYVQMITNYENPVLENNYENNSGPILTLNIFDPYEWENDNSIANLNPDLYASPSVPLNKTASLSPIDGSAYDIDWTGIAIDKMCDLNITINNDEEKNITLELYDSDGSTLLDSLSVNSEGTLSYRLTNNQPDQKYYFVKTYPTNHNIITSYQLDIDLEYVKPDLIANFNPDNTIYFKQGDPTPEIPVRVQNNSPVATDDFTCILIASDTSIFTEPYNQVNQFTVSLAAEETITNSLQVTPPTGLGDKYYAFIVDYHDEVSELNEDNNITEPIRLHSYIDDEYEIFNDDSTATENELVNGVSQIHSLVPNDDVDYMTFSITESSQITILLTSESELDLTLYEFDSQNNTSTIDLDDAIVTNGKNYTWSQAFDISDTVRRFCLRIEETQTDLEVDEYSINVRIKPHAPDLTVQLNDKYLSKFAGETTSITVRGSNIGSVATTNAMVELYIAPASENPQWTKKDGSEIIISSIDPGASKNATISFTTPESSGLYYIMAIIINDENEISESDITNNSSNIRILAIDHDYTYNGGSGTEADPWQIATALQLDTISEIPDHLDDFFILTSDIDMSGLGSDYSSIGSSPLPFTGVFDGQNYTISNLRQVTSSTVAGLFGYTDFSENSDIEYEISNINLANVNITSTNGTLPAGGLIASNGCWVKNCVVSGQVSAVTNAGLLAGVVTTGSGNMTPRISASSASGEVNVSGTIAGGLVGSNNGYVLSCMISDNSSVSGGSSCGGLIGENTGMIGYCYSWANVNSPGDYAGGLVANNTGIISSSYSTGLVSSAGQNKNGFCSNNTGTIIGCFWNISTSGLNDDGSGSGYVGLSATEMKDKEIYESAGWIFGADNQWLMADELMWPRLTALFNFSGGDGTEQSPNLIYTDIDFLLVSELPDRHYLLMKDFDLDGYYLQTSLFGNLEKNIPFTGTFDGNGYTISNITIKRGRDGSGLFGYIASKSDTETTAGVKNLIIKDITVETDGIYNIAGSLAGYIYNGFVSNCAVRNGYVFSSMYAGGLAGYAEKSLITDSCFVGKAEATLCAGGITGGLRNSSTDGCYAAAEVLALDYIDGITGFSRYSELTNCYWDSNLCPDGNSPTPINSETMKSVEFWFNDSGWDLVGESDNGNNDTWQVANSYYPWLSIETPEIIGDINKDQKVDLLDFMELSLCWLSEPDNSSYQTKCDLDNNDVIDISDLEKMVFDWQIEIISNW